MSSLLFSPLLREGGGGHKNHHHQWGEKKTLLCASSSLFATRQQSNNKIAFYYGGIAFLATLTAGVVVGGPLKNTAKTFSVECQDASSSSTTDEDDDFTTSTRSGAARKENNNNKKRYRIAHRTFRSEFSFVNNCLRLARNIANPTSIAALEFQKQLEQFDARFATWKEEYFCFSEEEEEEEERDESEEEDNEEEEEEEEKDDAFRRRRRQRRRKKNDSGVMFEQYVAAERASNGDANATREILLDQYGVDVSLERVREMGARRPQWPVFPWTSWKRLVVRGVIRDASISSCRVMISKHLEKRTTERFAMKLTKEARMSGKRKMGRFYALKKRGEEIASTSTSTSSLACYYSSKAALTKKFAKTHLLANFCNFSAVWVYDMFEDFLRCYNFHKHGGYIGQPVPRNEASLVSCAKLYVNCALKHSITALSSAFGSTTVAALTFYLFPSVSEGKGVYYALFLAQLAGDHFGIRLARGLNATFGFRGLPRLAAAAQ